MIKDIKAQDTRVDRCGVLPAIFNSTPIHLLGCGEGVYDNAHVVFGLPGVPEGESITYHEQCLPRRNIYPRRNT